MGTGPSMLTQYDIEEVQAHVQGKCEPTFYEHATRLGFSESRCIVT